MIPDPQARLLTELSQIEAEHRRYVVYGHDRDEIIRQLFQWADRLKTLTEQFAGEAVSVHSPEPQAWQELYDATTVLQAALTFTHTTYDLMKPELNLAIERVIYARSALRKLGQVTHSDMPLPAVRSPEPQPEKKP